VNLANVFELAKIQEIESKYLCRMEILPKGKEGCVKIFFRVVSVSGKGGVEVVEIDYGSFSSKLPKSSSSCHHPRQFCQLGRKRRLVLFRVNLERENLITTQF